MSSITPNGESPATLTPDQALQQAAAQHQAGQLQEAEKLYRAILQAHPSHPLANHNMGVLAMLMEQPSVGLPYFLAALEADPTQAQYWLSYIDALIRADQTDDARQILTLARQQGLEGSKVEAMILRLEGSTRIIGQSNVIPSHKPKDSKPTSSPMNARPGSKPSRKARPHKGKNPSQQEIASLVALFTRGCFVEAEANARAMTVRFPMHWIGWKMLGVLFQQKGCDADALLPMQTAVGLSPGDAEAHNNLGVILKKLGRLEESVASYRRALQLKPDYAQAHCNLGATLQDMERLEEAEASYRLALQFAPNYARAHCNLGAVLHDLGRLDEAEASYRRALQLKSDDADTHGNLGSVLSGLGRLDEAEASLRKALEINPEFAGAHSNLGSVLLVMGRPDEAEASQWRALTINPKMSDAHFNLGNTFKSTGRLDEAEASYRQALRIKPECVQAHNNLGITLRELGRVDEATMSHRLALQVNPDRADTHANLGIALHEAGRLEEAAAAYRTALQIKPDMVEAHNNLANTLQQMGRLAEAEACYRRALEIKPEFFAAHSNLGVTHQDMGRLAEAEACYRRALEINPEYTQARSNLLFVHNYTSSHTPKYCLEEAEQYGRKASEKIATRFAAWPCAKQPERLRIGFVSGDMTHHPVGYFLEGLLANLDPASVELIAYPTASRTDDLTARIRPRFSSWNPLFGRNDESAARQIHGDGVHVLIDLSGHTRYNRLPVFAWKPAPVQVTWMGYFATTGLAEMDYLLGDRYVAPAEDASHFTEKLWQLPECYICFTEPDVKLQVAALPALSTGHITFGCFNTLTKMSDAVVATWARILAEIPGSRLFLKTKQLGEDLVRRSTLDRFARYGVGADRLILESASPRNELLASYDRVDIALDPFPYPGGTTSIEGLWMGVPVITKRGDRFLSHVGETIAHNAGLTEWIAADEEEYVAKAVACASDIQQLAKLREGLRPMVLASPLFDAARFARHFQAAMWGMWQRWQSNGEKS